MTNYADLTNLVEILKNVYGEGLRNQFNDEKTTYNMFPKSERSPKGLGYIFGLRYSRAQSTGGRAESAKLPDPMTGVKDQGKIVPRYLYGTIRLTGPAIEAAKGNEAAFVDSLADEMDDIYQSIVVDMNRQSHSDGFGKVGTVSAAFVPVISAGTYDVVFSNDLGITYMQEGMLIDFFIAAGTSPVITCCGQRIKSINPATKTVTFYGYAQTWLTNHPDPTIAGYTNDATQVAAGVIAIKMGSRPAAWTSASTPNEITGLAGIFDDGTLLAAFENITVATNPKWAAQIMSNSAIARELEIDLLINACDLVRLRSGLTANQMLMNLGQRRKYANLLIPEVRYQPTQLKGGYETLTFSGGDGSVEIKVDPLAMPGEIKVYPTGKVEKYEMTALGWGNLDGNQMLRRSGYDEWDLFLRLYTNLGCEQRNCLVKISDLVEPAMY